MHAKRTTLVVHVLGVAAVCAIGTYWTIRVATPAPTAAPPPVAAALPRDSDPVLTARMFGLEQSGPVARADDVQVLGIFAAGAESVAVLAIDGKPARAYMLGAQVAPGSWLAEVRAGDVTIESNGVRRQVRVAARAGYPASAAPTGFRREGNVLSAPTVAGGDRHGARAPPQTPWDPPPPFRAPVVLSPPPPTEPMQPPIQPDPATGTPTGQTEEEATGARRLLQP